MNEVTLDLIDGVEMLTCDCGATAPNNSREGARFARRHPKRCSERKEFTKQIAQGTRSVDADLPEDEDAAGVLTTILKQLL